MSERDNRTDDQSERKQEEQPQRGQQPPQDRQPPQGEQPPQGRQPPQGQQPPQDRQPPQGQQPPQDQQPPQGRRPPRNRRSPVAGGGRSEEVNFAIFGVLTYAIVGLGIFVTALLGSLLGGNASQIVSSNNELFSSATGTLDSLVTLGPIAGAVLGIYYYRTDTTMQRPAKAAGIAAAAGILAISVLLLLFMILFDPSGGSSAAAGAGFQGPTVGVEVGDEIPAVLGISVGTALTAAGTGFLLEEDPLDIF